MDLYQKISILGPNAQYDTCGPKDFGLVTDIPGVYRANVGGRVCRIYKVLQTNSCRNNCRYCALRRDRQFPRVKASSEELAKSFINVYSRRLVEGFFLSSAIIGSADNTMQMLIDTATIVRKQYGYKGYLHLKIMPGSSPVAVKEALGLASRVSLNIESPTEKSLANLSSEKNLQAGFYNTLKIIKKEIDERKYSGKKAPSITTQFVVGGGGENDREIIRTSGNLYQEFGLKRIFYSAFRPVPETPLADKPAASLVREHRLYQTDFLMRFYRFLPGQIPTDQSGFLFEEADPKFIWAQKNPQYFPIDINRADYWDLLKVPGIGPTSAKKILEMRQHCRIQTLNQFAKKRFLSKKLSAYVRL